MVSLSKRAENVNVVRTDNVAILFSYETAIAFSGVGGFGPWYVDPTKYSKTTSRHLNTAIGKDPANRRRLATRGSFVMALEAALAGKQFDVDDDGFVGVGN